MRYVILAIVVAASSSATADSSFQVNPTRISLSTAEPAEAAVITNHGTEPLRVQLTVMTWKEDANGSMVLAPTTDVVVRPSLLLIEPGRNKTVRVGSTLATPATEGSYRLFVEQLPDRRTQESGRIVMLTRIGVPVFIAPAKATLSMTSTVSFDATSATVAVTATGTTHAKLASIIVRAARSGTVRWERRVVGWYVLPGSERRFVVPLEGEQCRVGEMVTAELVAEGGATWTSIPRLCE